MAGDAEHGFRLAHPRFQSYLTDNRLKEPTQRPYREALIAYCARWREHESLYALRHYAEHLADTGTEPGLFTLARDDEFAAAQARILPSEPRLPATTSELAFAVAAQNDDAPGMAEFALRKARQLAVARTALSPLQAVREIGAEAAWTLADLYEPEHRALWHLLTAWELQDADQVEAARMTLQRLAEGDLAPLSSDMGFPILAALRALDVELTSALGARLLSDETRSNAALSFASAGNFTAALKTAQAIQNDWSRADALTSVAQAQAAAGETAAALETAQAIEDEEARAGALVAVARAQAKAGDTPAALETARAIEDVEWRREEALVAVAEAQAEAGETAAALETAQSIESDWSRADALVPVARAQAKAGDTPAALETAQAIEDADRRLKALASVAGGQAEAGDTAAALETVQAIDDEDGRVNALASVAQALAEAGDTAARLRSCRRSRKSRCGHWCSSWPRTLRRRQVRLPRPS